MINANSILICPLCRVPLCDELHCHKCGAEYERKHGVYNIVSDKISQGQQILWNIPEEALAEDTDLADFVITGNEWTEDYESKKNDETKAAEKKLFACMELLISRFTGTVCDLATGMGTMLSLLLASENKNFDIVCTDISPNVLAYTRKAMGTDDDRVSYIAMDGRCTSAADDTFDYITSYEAFGNIPDTARVAREIYRMLKPEGKLIIMGSYIEKASDSFELAEMVGVERGLVEEYLIADLRAAGFRNAVSTVVAEAVWAENSYDLVPIAGDKKRYCIISAVK
ncbi:MAG: methyltransferase domain-containing protein [Ruminococcaceae bacterium]|nr:methyltransferase domain-containing protein [Oscillospiraceae bacterium]